MSREVGHVGGDFKDKSNNHTILDFLSTWQTMKKYSVLVLKSNEVQTDVKHVNQTIFELTRSVYPVVQLLFILIHAIHLN